MYGMLTTAVQGIFPSGLITQGEVRVTVPGYVSLRRAEGFLISKKQWIMSKLI